FIAALGSLAKREPLGLGLPLRLAVGLLYGERVDTVGNPLGFPPRLGACRRQWHIFDAPQPQVMDLVVALISKKPMRRRLALDAEHQPTHIAIGMLAGFPGGQQLLDLLHRQRLCHSSSSMDGRPTPTVDREAALRLPLQPGWRQPTDNVGAQRTKIKRKLR